MAHTIDDPRLRYPAGLVNPEIRVRWCGWESDTYTLGRAGWAIGIEEEPIYGDSYFVFRHDHLGIIARSEPLRWRHGRPGRTIDCVMIEKMAFRKNVMFVAAPSVNFRTIETEPRWDGSFTRDMWREGHPFFDQKAAPVAEQLIVEPQDVATMLDQIRRMQAPEQAAIRERERRREARREVHAQIISLAA